MASSVHWGTWRCAGTAQTERRDGVRRRCVKEQPVVLSCIPALRNQLLGEKLWHANCLVSSCLSQERVISNREVP